MGEPVAVFGCGAAMPVREGCEIEEKEDKREEPRLLHCIIQLVAKQPIKSRYSCNNNRGLLGSISSCWQRELFFCCDVLQTYEMTLNGWLGLLWLLRCIQLTKIISMSGDDGQEYLINNGRRYEVTIPKYSRQHDYILYEATVLDTAFFLASSFSFRFRTLKKMHEKMLKQTTSDSLPQFPRTKSFALWNRTNEDPKMIQERIRDLEYYLTKLLNCSQLKELREMQLIRKAICSARPQRRLSAEVKITREEKEGEKARLKECPQFYRRQSTATIML